MIKNNEAGMTLVELVTVVGILSVLTALVVSAFNSSRDHNDLLSSEQAIQSFLRQAQQMSLDQMREQDCIDALVVGVAEKLCSKIGVALLDGDARFFADINDNNRYDNGTDYDLDMEAVLPGSVQVVNTSGTVWQSFIFEANPPVVVVHAFVNATNVTLNPANPHVDITLRSARGTEQVLRVHPYAQVSRP